jgi:hypothetical protein
MWRYTEGSFYFGFVMSDCGNKPKSDITNRKYTEGVNPMF